LDENRVAMKNECDYVKEAEMTRKMRSFLEGDATFGVPKVFSELSTRHVMTTEMLSGVPIDQVEMMNSRTM
jgi:aarF domain-containing kinase